MNFDSTADFSVVDNTVPVTLRMRGESDVRIGGALVEPTLFKEMEPAGGQTIQGDLKWIWPIALSPSRPPLGSVIIDSSGAYWTILAIRKTPAVNTWEAITRNLSIESAPMNKATILRATYTKSPGNVASPEWHAILTGVAARFQPSTEAAQIFLGSEYTKTTYRVIFQEPVPLELAGGQYRLIDSEGHHYRVVEYIDAQRIDRLPVAIAVKITEGGEYFSGGSESSF